MAFPLPADFSMRWLFPKIANVGLVKCRTSQLDQPRGTLPGLLFPEPLKQVRSSDVRSLENFFVLFLSLERRPVIVFFFSAIICLADHVAQVGELLSFSPNFFSPGDPPIQRSSTASLTSSRTPPIYTRKVPLGSLHASEPIYCALVIRS